jgi:aminoglycoside 6'-N-acetyltransferase I
MMEPSIEIRRVCVADADLFDVVMDDVFDAPIDQQRLLAFLAEARHLMVVATDAQRIVGQARAIIHLSPDQPDELYLDNFGVTPSFQLRGIGGLLCDELLRWGRERGCRYAWLGTEPNNAPARVLYSSRGMQETPMLMFECNLV